jgi:molybdopterin synthase catalytic subunit
MQSELTLTREPIDEAAWLARRAMTREMGAAVCFSGVVRGTEGGEAIAALEYEAFERMARHQIELLFQRVEERWPVQSVRVAHRLGRVGAGRRRCGWKSSPRTARRPLRRANLLLTK